MLEVEFTAAELEERTRPIYADVGYYVRENTITDAFRAHAYSTSQFAFLVRAALRQARKVQS